MAKKKASGSQPETERKTGRGAAPRTTAADEGRTAKKAGTSAPKVPPKASSRAPAKGRRSPKAHPEKITCDQKLDLVLLHSVMGIGFWDTEGRIVLFNRVAAQHAGRPAGELIGRTAREVFGEVWAATLAHRFKEAAASDEALVFEDFASVASGDRWFRSIYSRILGAGGEVLGTQVLSEDITEKKRVEGAFRESQDRFRHIVENSPNSFFYVQDRFEHYSYISPAVEEVLGYPPEHFLGPHPRVWTDSPLNEKVPEYDRMVWEAQVSPPPYLVECRRADGTCVILEAFERPLLREGRIVEVLGLATDVSDRLRSQEALHSAETRYRALFEQSPDGIVILDPDTGLILEANEAASRQLGFTQEEFLGMSIADIDAQETSEETRDRIQRVLQEGRIDFDTLQRTKSGEVRSIHVTAEIVDAGPRQLYLGIWRDITDRKRAEAALALSRAQMKALADHMSEGLMRVDGEDRILYVNPRLCQMLGYSEGELLGKVGLELLVPEEDRPTILQKNRDRVRGISDRYRTRMRAKSGQILDLEVSGSPVPATGELPEGSIGILTDITERLRADEAVREAQRFSQATLDALADTICVVDGRGTIVAVNSRWREFAKENGDFAGGSFEGANYLEVCDRARGADRSEAEAFAAGLRAVLSGEREGFSMEYACHSPSIRRWFIGRVTRFPGEGPVRAVISHQNITDRKVAEEELRESEERHRALVEAIPDMMFRVTREGVLWDCKADSGSPLYAPPEAFLGKRIEAVLPPALARAGLDAMASAAATGEVQAFDYSLPVGGSDRSFEARVVGEGEGGAVFIVRDVTDRVRAEDALRESEAKFARVFDQSNVPAAMQDVEGRYLSCNKAFVDFLGYTEAELVGRRFSELTHPDDQDKGPPQLPALLRGELDAVRAQKRYVRADGNPVWGDSTVSAVRSPSGEPQFLVVQVQDVTERQRAEEALSASEETFRTYVEQAADAIVVHDGEGRVLDANGAACAGFGYTREELLQMRVTDLDPDLDLARARREWSRAVPGEPRTYQGRARRKDGSIFPLEIRFGCFDLRGERRLICLVRDITERVEAEAALRASESLYRATLDGLMEGGQIIGFDWRYRYINRAAELHNRRPAAELLGNRYMDMWPGIDETPFFAALRRSMEERVPLHLENEFVFPDGQVGWFDLSIQPVHEGMFILSVEVSERHRFEEALRKSEAEFRAVYENNAAALALINADTTLADVNDAYCAIGGFTREEVIGRSWTTQIVPEDLERLKEYNRRRLAGDPAAPDKYEFRFFDSRGEVHDALMSVALVPALDKIVASFVDITERKRSEREIQRLNAELATLLRKKTTDLDATSGELDNFAYSVSHDLRAPLRGIDGWSQALEEDYGGVLDERGRGYLATVRGETKRMGQLVDSLLEISRVTRSELSLEPVDLAEIAHQVKAAILRAEGERRVAFVLPESLPAQADPNLMRILFRHLFGNAWKFTKGRDDGRIEVGAETSGGSTVYFVRDNGVGFDMAYAGKLFRPFQRLHPQDQYPGAGVGLATVQRIVRRHGGRAWAEGKVGEGATFYFTLEPDPVPAKTGPESLEDA